MIVLVTVASVGLICWLVVTVGRSPFEIRAPRASALAALGLRRTGTRRSDPEDTAGTPEQVPEPDVELAVRERLYGPGARAPRG